MTPQERAEKIVKDRFRRILNPSDLALIEEIAAQIEEACAEEFAKGALDQQIRCSKHCEQQRLEGFSAAREMAKGIAEDHKKVCPEPEFHDSCGAAISNLIARLEPK